jgi:catechol 2,3-dioxygenase-like lactoylglutathione lyase family enzyme
VSGFPGEVTEVLHLRVVADVAASKAYYVDVLGASVVRETGELVFVDLAGARIVLSAAGGPTEDKPTVTFAPAADPETVSAELILRVTDTRATYAELLRRGATFLTPPVDFLWETRCFVRDPDGYLIELTQPPANVE